MFDPVLFASTMHETASEAFLFCKSHLEKGNRHNAARRLEGLDPITDNAMGRLALGALTEIRPMLEGDAESLSYADIAINALKRAVGPTASPLQRAA